MLKIEWRSYGVPLTLDPCDGTGPVEKIDDTVDNDNTTKPKYVLMLLSRNVLLYCKYCIVLYCILV